MNLVLSLASLLLVCACSLTNFLLQNAVPIAMHFGMVYNCTTDCDPAVAPGANWGLDNTQYGDAVIQPFPPQFLAGLGPAIRFPRDSISSAGFTLVNVLTALATTFVSQPLGATSNVEYFVEQLQAAESLFTGIPPRMVNESDPTCPPPLCNSTFGNPLSSSLQSCVDRAQLTMLCSAPVPENRFDYVCRVFGYTFFIFLGVQLAILIAHLIFFLQGRYSHAHSRHADLKQNPSYGVDL
jgi:hypothetical protein